ncbi:MAG: GNAT family N-acetyltransferase [Anaerolineales bacterium]
MRFIKKKLTHDDDYWRARAFLRQVYILNNRKPISWSAVRLDYWKNHITAIDNHKHEATPTLWETPAGEIIAAIFPEGPGHAHLQYHPDHYTTELVEEMVAEAEAGFYRVTDEGKRRLIVWCHDHDALRKKVLMQHGFARGENWEWAERQRVRSLVNEPLPEFPTAEGYTIRSLGGPEEIPSRSWASWRAFHPDSPDEDYEGWDWYPKNIQTQPMYRRDLDIVAIAPDGEVAAFTTLWYDDVTRTGYFEPVGTVPEHQRKGLAKSVICEGMRRIKAMGAVSIEIGGSSIPANKVYAAVASEACLVNAPWIKEWADE